MNFIHLAEQVNMTNSNLSTHFEAFLRNPEFREGEFWQKTRYSAGDLIIQEGADDADIFVLQSGCARVIGEIDLDENRQIRPGVFDLHDGDVFGELALFDRQLRSATVESVTDCTTIKMDGYKLLEFLDKNPVLGFHFMRALMTVTVERLRKSNKKVLSLLAWGLKVHQIDTHL